MEYVFTSYYIVLGVSFLISLIAQIIVKATFSKYSKVAASTGITGAQTASMLLTSQGINNVSIGRVAGSLTDHYNPSNNTLVLSEPVYGQNSISAIAVAAHECGHAMQHATGYFPLSLRTKLVPAVNISSRISWIFIIIGLLYYTAVGNWFLYIGIILFSAAVVFQLVTLPVELNASRRALTLLKQNGILAGKENSAARKVLNAAALTYVAATCVSVIQLLRLVLIARSRRN